MIVPSEERPSGIICIGGSAGALEPLLTIVAAIPADLHTPVVVALHRGYANVRPGRSTLLGLMGRATSRRVREVEDLDDIVDDSIFLAPPGYHTLVDRDCLVLSAEEPERYSIPSIDALFASAAHSFGVRSLVVALSCANFDGALGARTVSERGGRVIVQDPATAGHAQLVGRIIGDGTPAQVLAPSEIAAQLLQAERAWRARR